MHALARAALYPLTLEFEHAQKIDKAISSVSIAGANQDELGEAQDLVRESLTNLPAGSTEAREIAGPNQTGAKIPLI
jgi:hypothetical protein